MFMTTKLATSAAPLFPEATGCAIDDSAIDFYRAHGFVRVRGIISREEADAFRDIALDISEREASYSSSDIFDQHVNVWTKDDGIKKLTFHPQIARVAEILAGVPLRLWHDQILIKKPHNKAATEFHQDQPYWPHSESPNPISCWIALCDVPVERGCMTFIPDSHFCTDLEAQNFGDARSFFNIAPDLEFNPRVSVPLKKGDCTFHHGRCAHMATPNFTDDPRVAHVVIFVDASARYNGRPHVITKPLGFEVGAPLEGDLFPLAADMYRKS
jgi:ectoine hydroxylase-related dioxygenase (phytanoyl-CoA dioxygenase family)